MSLGGGTSDAINGAVKDAIKEGAVFVVSAGNNGYSACRKSPASVEEAVTVAAVNEESAEADYSNFGKCVDVYAYVKVGKGSFVLVDIAHSLSVCSSVQARIFSARG